MANALTTLPNQSDHIADPLEEEDELLPPERESWFGFRKSAIVEMLLFFALTLAIDWIFLDGTRYWDMSLHPFFIIVVLVSAQYGSSEGLLAAVAASFVLLIGNLPEQTLDGDWYDYMYQIMYRPVLWLATGLLLGELRLRQIRERAKLREALRETEDREQYIASEFKRLQGQNEKLELHVASQMRTGLAAYRAAMTLEKLEPRDVILGINRMVQTITHANKCSVFLLNKGKLEVSVTRNWDEKDAYTRTFTSDSPLYKRVVGDQKIACVVNDDDRKFLVSEGLIAGPIINQDSGEVIGMLKIEEMGFLDLNITTVTTFTMLCEWIGTTYAHAMRYSRAREDSIEIPEHHLLSRNLLQRQAEFMRSLGERVGFDVSMIILRLEDSEDMSKEGTIKAATALGEAVKSALRKIDQAYEYQHNSREFAILLPYTSAKNAPVVIKKITAALTRKQGKTKEKATFSHEVRAVYEHKTKA